VEHRHLVNGELIDGPDWFEVIDPATGSPFAKCARASADLISEAVDAAKRAQPRWAAKSAWARSQHIMALADALELELQPLARPREWGISAGYKF
jgi:acyl-CoA reductase-like NAD-dependent aldehyde dehydrogenase